MKTLSTNYFFCIKLKWLVALVFLSSFISEVSGQCTIAAPDTVVKCFGQTYNLGTGVTVSGTTGTVTYSWNGGPSATTPNKNVSPTVTTTYTLQITDGVGCIASKDVTIRVIPIPVVNAGADVQICIGNSIQLCATATSANGPVSVYNWISGGPAAACKTVSPVTETTYTVYALDPAGCASTDNVTVFVNPLPVVNAGADVTMCLAEGSRQMFGTPAGGIWSGTNVTPGGLFTPPSVNNYTLTYSYTNSSTGCTNTDQVVVSVSVAPSINGGPDREMCLNSGAIQLPNVGTWNGSPSVSPSGLFTPNSVGIQNLTVSSGSGVCAATDQVTVNVFALPTVNAGANVSICSGQCAQLNAVTTSPNGSINSINWSGGTVSNPSISNPSACPTTNTTYTVHVIDGENCQANSSVTITVNPTPNVDAGNAITVCTNGGPVTLIGYSPSGGSWSGTGVNPSGVFTPGTSGDVVLTYSYTSGANCTNSSTRTIHVINPTPVNAGNDIEVCLNTAPVQLLSGGTWGGSPWVSSSGLFTPGAIGTYLLTYSTVIGQCTSTDQVQVQVLSLPNVNAGSDQNVCVGATVQLNGTATSSNGSISSLQWSENYVSNQNVLNPTFTASTTATLTLTATDSKNCTASDQVIVNVSPIPTVEAGNDITVCTGSGTIILTGHTPSGGTWSGSGVTSGGVFTPSAAGDITLTYAYTNSSGCSNSDARIIHVVSPSSVDAGSDREICLNASPVQLMAGGTWSGSSWVSASGLFTPGAIGTYPLTYSTIIGQCSATDEIIVHVNALPIANAGLDDAVCIGDTFQLNGSASGGSGGYQYSWNHPSLLSNHNIANPVLTTTSTTLLTLTVTDNNQCSNTDNVQISVVSYPVPSFSIPLLACVNSSITYSNTSTGALSYDWNFGDNSTSASANPTHSYSQAGLYTVVLTATNGVGCSEFMTKEIEIIETPQASFSVSASQGCSPLHVEFQNQSTGVNVSYQWNLSSSTSTDVNPSGIDYTASGTNQPYNISLIATNICGSDNHVEVINVLPQPIAHFETSLSTQCSPVITHFQNLSQGNPETYLWEFGDGFTSQALQPSPRSYFADDAPENYIIKLFAYNQCGQDMEELTLTILPNTIEPVVTPSVLSGCAPLFVQFSNTTTGATQYHFDFDDGESSSLNSPAHIFNSDGTFDVRYVANDGCSYDTLNMTIQVLSTPTISISANHNAVCPFEEVAFQSQTTGNIQYYVWNFGDGNSSNDSAPVHAFEEGDLYTIGASVVAQNGCESSASVTVNVHPKPNAAIALVDNINCSPWTLCPQNQTTGASNYQWNFGNGVESSQQNPCTEYLNFGSSVIDYEISLLVENEFGCTDNISELIHVQPQPETEFVLSDNESCFFNEYVTVSLNSTGASSYEWYVDDVLTSNAASPVFQFSGVGEHTTRVVALNSYGCNDTYNQVYTIHPTPTVDILPQPFNGCAPLTVQFENETANGTQFQWAFSNGQSSTHTNPEVVFENPGLYDVQLTAISEHGCQSNQYFEDMIEVFAIPTSFFSLASNEEVLYDINVSFINESEGAVSYTWDFGDGYINSESNPIHQYNTGGDYNVELTSINEYGCTSTYNRLVRIDNTVYVFVPSSFSPNADGVNDLFIPSISSLDEIYTYSFQVCNRWGEVVFITDNPMEGWKGDVHSGEYYVHNDIFTWSIVISYKNGQEAKRYKGDVTVLR